MGREYFVCNEPLACNEELKARQDGVGEHKGDMTTDDSHGAQGERETHQCGVNMIIIVHV